LITWAGGTDFAWVDDEITEADREWIADNHPGALLLVRADPHCGLTASDLDILEG
jgi:hypothetical protein